MTRLDAFILTSTLLVFFSLIEVLITTILETSRRTGRAKKIDRYCRAIFPAMFLIAAIAIFVHRAADPNEGFVLRSARHGPCEQSYVSAPKDKRRKTQSLLRLRNFAENET